MATIAAAQVDDHRPLAQPPAGAGGSRSGRHGLSPGGSDLQPCAGDREAERAAPGDLEEAPPGEAGTLWFLRVVVMRHTLFFPTSALREVTRAL
ncbi:MAG: hypothetical protein HYX95_01305 [Chloroflexi bacterium]|nr:hypothetical protein [Chloroflexota bacterium]